METTMIVETTPSTTAGPLWLGILRAETLTPGTRGFVRVIARDEPPRETPEGWYRRFEVSVSASTLTAACADAAWIGETLGDCSAELAQAFRRLGVDIG